MKLFRIFAQNSAKNRYFSTFFIDFCTNVDQDFTEFRRIFQKMMSNPKNAEFPMDSSRYLLNSDEFRQNFDRILMSKIRIIRSLANRIFQPCRALGPEQRDEVVNGAGVPEQAD